MKLASTPHWGPTLENFLEEEGILEEANAYATKKMLAWQMAPVMKEQGNSRSDPAGSLRLLRQNGLQVPVHDEFDECLPGDAKPG